MENIKEFKEKINEVITVKNELDKEIDEFIEEYRGWSDIGETYGRILFFLSSGFSEKALNKINETLFNNAVEVIVFNNNYLANYSLHRIHSLYPEARKEGLEFISKRTKQEVTIDFVDLIGKMTDEIPVLQEVKEFLDRFKDDISWRAHMSSYHNHEESNFYQDAVENLQIKVGSADLDTLKFVIDNLQSMFCNRLEICCLDYDRLFKEKLCKN